MIKVLIIEDHKMVRSGFEKIFSSIKNMEVIGSVSTGTEGIDLFREKCPDIILLDYNLPDLNGLSVISKVKKYKNGTKIIVVSSLESDDLTMQLLDAGIDGFISKKSDSEEIPKAIETILSGSKYISFDIASKIALKRSGEKALFEKLSGRELEVAMMIINGFSHTDIAKKLNMQLKTVHTNRYRIFEKLNIECNDVQLFRLALKAGIVRTDGLFE